MSGEETIKPEAGDFGHPAGTIGTDVEVVGKPIAAICELVDTVTEATWKEALSQLGGLPSNPLSLWAILASRILRAVAIGERDPQALKRFALDGLNEYELSGKDR